MPFAVEFQMKPTASNYFLVNVQQDASLWRAIVRAATAEQAAEAAIAAWEGTDNGIACDQPKE